MCSNYENELKIDRLSGALRRGDLDAWIRDHAGDTKRIYPKQLGTVIRSDGDDLAVEEWRWGLVPFFSKEGPAHKLTTHNARDDRVRTAPTYRGPWQRGQRCLLPASSWYESAKTLGHKGWVRIHPSAQGITFGGLWDRWNPPEGAPLYSYTMLTVAPAPSLVRVRDRMPFIVPARARAAWLDSKTSPDRALAMLAPTEDEYTLELADKA